MISTAALIIASGKTSTRDGFLPEREVGTISALRRIVIVFHQAGIERVAVVCGTEEDKTEKLAFNLNVDFLHSGPEAEMFDNVRIGLDYLRDKCRSVIITHADVPLFSTETVKALLMAKGGVRVPVFSGKQGHPIYIAEEYFNPVIAYDGGGGLAGAVNAIGAERSFVEVDDEGIGIDLRYTEEYRHLLPGHSLNELHPDFTLTVTKEKPFYGPNAHQLLTLTAETGSLREACRRMGISYSKGHGIISLIEEQLEAPVLESSRGGKTGGMSFVTENGKRLMESYTGFNSEANKCLSELFNKYFKLIKRR